ncbi:MAG: diguanylate cyclase [Oscillospiraceae bacterium]|nr:diguanylate cyclase [Oscillospiraceae bacterium]
MDNTRKKRISPVTAVLLIELIVMSILVLIVTKTVGSRTRENSLEHMKTITDERAQIVENYIQECEKTLTAYSRAGQITDMLKASSSGKDITALQELAQQYTEKYSFDIKNLEGIYVSTWDTKVLAHTNPDYVGMITRTEANSLQQLQEAMSNAGNGVYNTGIIISPATRKQIVSMYKAVYDDDNNPIGLVGLGVYTNGLIETLDNLEIRGFKHNAFSYSMVNVNENKYIFHPNQAYVTKEIGDENSELLTLCERLRLSQVSTTDTFEYTQSGTKYVATYSYMKNHAWLLMLNAEKSEVFALATQLRVAMLILGIMILGLLIVFSIINKRQETTSRKLNSQIAKNEKAKQSLTTAMFKDILTNVGNRVSFTMDLDKLQTSVGMSYYFAMFNISSFSDININFGDDIGDEVLVNTVSILQKNFPDGLIYRIGSDEFVVIQMDADSVTGYNNITNIINTVHASLSLPFETSNGTFTSRYKIALLKQTKNLNAHIISILKEMTNRTGDAVFGQIQYMDMDSKMEEAQDTEQEDTQL